LDYGGGVARCARTHRSVLVLLVTRVGLGTTARGVFGASIFAAAATCDVGVSGKRDGQLRGGGGDRDVAGRQG
jgi:hypothetical protein